MIGSALDARLLADSLLSFGNLLASGLMLIALAPVVLGLVVTVCVTVFQIQDSTVPAVTRIVAVCLTSALFGKLVIERFIQFAIEMFRVGANVEV